MGELIVELAGESARERPRHSEDHHADVPEGHIGAERSGAVGGVDQALDESCAPVTGSQDLVIEWNRPQEHRDDGCDAGVQGGVHVANERGERIRLLVEGAVGFLRDALEGFADDGAHEGLPVGEAPIQRGDARAGPSGDVLQRRARPLFDEHVAGGTKDPGSVQTRIRAQLLDLAGRLRPLDHHDPPLCRHLDIAETGGIISD
jgi:hypothetical protein